jgi:hypothetical protein
VHSCIAILISTSKNALSSYYCLCLLFNKIGKENKTVLPGSEGGGREREGAGGQEGEVAQTMYAHMNK